MLNNIFYNIANAIRYQQQSHNLYCPDDMANAILHLGNGQLYFTNFEQVGFLSDIPNPELNGYDIMYYSNNIQHIKLEPENDYSWYKNFNLKPYNSSSNQPGLLINLSHDYTLYNENAHYYTENDFYPTYVIGESCDTYRLFENCYNFNSNIIFSSPSPNYFSSLNIQSLLFNCTIFNKQLNLNDISAPIYMDLTFTDCHKLNSFINFNNSHIRSAAGAFQNCYIFNQPINWSSFYGDSASYSQGFSNMFYDCRHFNQPINFLNMAEYYYMSISNMFYNCGNFSNQNVYFHHLNNLDNAFKDCYNTIALNIFFKTSSSISATNCFLNTGYDNVNNNYKDYINIYTNNFSPFTYTDLRGIGTSLDWTPIENGYTNELYKINIYNNYI